MFIPRHETEVLQEKLNQALNEKVGSTILISGEPGIGKTTLIKNFLKNCDATSEKNVLTAVGSCLDMDGVSRGFLPWREVLIELDADKAAGKDEEKKTNFKKIVKTVFDEAGSQWLEAIPVIGDISSAIFETAKSAKKDELIDVETGDTKKLALKDRLKNVAKECTGEWLNVIPVVGNLSAAIYKTTTAIQKSKQVTYSQNQQDFFIRVMSRFRELAEHNPVIIYIDDLQWADISSMNLFFYLAKNLKDSPYPMILLGSFRPQDVKDGRINPISGEMERHPWEEKINNLKRYDAIQLIEISYLNQNQIDSFIDLQFPSNEFSQKFKDEIVSLTKGNSLFVRELLLNLQEREIIFNENGVFKANENLDLTNLPQTVTGIIEERFQRLSEDLQEILQVASAQGSDFSLELIASILEINNFKLSKKINTLQKKYSLVLKSETVYDKLKKIYNFTHNLVQKYVYYQMTQDFRLDLHSALVETLEEFFEGDEIYKVAEPYSYHFGVANGIIDENGKLQLENEIEEETLKKYLKLQEHLGESYENDYRNDEAIQKYLEISRIAKLLNDKKLEIEFYLKLVNIHHHLGQFEETTSFLEECLLKSKKYGYRKLEGKSYSFLGAKFTLKGDYEKAMEFYRKSLDIYEEIDWQKGVIETFLYIGNIYYNKSDYEKGFEYFKKSLKISEEIGDKKTISRAFGNIGIIFSERGDFEKGFKYFKKSLKISEEIGDKIEISSVTGNMGLIHIIKSDYDKGLECLNEAIKISEEIGDKKGISIVNGSIGDIYFYKGNFDKGFECYKKSLKISEEIGDKKGISEANGKMGIIYDVKGDYDNAMNCYKKQQKICEELENQKGISSAVRDMGNIYAEKGDYEKALEFLQKSLNIFEELGDKVEISSLFRNLGVIYAKKGDYEKALEYYNKAIALSRELEAKSRLCVQLIAKAELLFLVKNYEEAKNLNSEAFEIVKEIDIEYIFENDVLTEKINFALGDTENPPKQFLAMLSQTEKKEEIATLNYELWKMVGEEKYKIESLKSYQELYSKTPKFEYKKRIEELEK